MKAESILFLLSIHEGNELRDQLPGSAYDDLSSAGLIDGTDITDRGYAYVRQLEAVELPVQMWVDPRSLQPENQRMWDDKVEAIFVKAARDLERDAGKVALASGEPFDIVSDSLRAYPAKIKPPTVEIAPPSGYSANPGVIPPGVDRASDISIVRANGKRKTLPAQTINWADKTTPDRVVGWRYAAAGAEARIHTPGETMPAPDPSVQ